MSAFTRIDGWPVAIAVAPYYLAMKAAFEARFPGIRLVISSGIRTYDEQVAIFTSRYSVQWLGNGPYGDVRWWRGRRYVRHSGAGTVAQPGTSNHETGRSLDLRDTGADAGVSASFSTARNLWLSANAHRWGFVHTGRNFGEPWHFEQHGVVDPWGGHPKPTSIDATDPGSAPTGGAGGGSLTPSTPTSEEDDPDMRLIRITDGNAKGRHYAIAPEYIKQIKTAEAVKAVEDAFGIKERPISSWTLTRVLGAYGIPSGVLNRRGYVLDDLNGQGKHVSGGTWSRAQKTERLAYVAGK